MDLGLRYYSLVLVPPRYTSRKCRQCNHIAKENRKSQAMCECVKCGHKENADVNPSHHILAAGRAVLAHGDVSSAAR